MLLFGLETRTIVTPVLTSAATTSTPFWHKRRELKSYSRPTDAQAVELLLWNSYGTSLVHQAHIPRAVRQHHTLRSL